MWTESNKHNGIGFYSSEKKKLKETSALTYEPAMCK